MNNFFAISSIAIAAYAGIIYGTNYLGKRYAEFSDKHIPFVDWTN